MSISAPITAILLEFQPVFSSSTWHKALLLRVGTVLKAAGARLPLPYAMPVMLMMPSSAYSIMYSIVPSGPALNLVTIVSYYSGPAHTECAFNPIYRSFEHMTQPGSNRGDPRTTPGRAGAAGVLLVDARGWVLLQHRDATAPRSASKWGFPGGIIEPGETPEEAARRELMALYPCSSIFLATTAPAV